MPDITISDLPAGADADGAVIPADRGTTTVKLTPAQIVTEGGASALTVDDTNLDVIMGTTAQACFESADDAVLQLRTTGHRFGGLVTVNGAVSTTIDVTAGAGAILDNTSPAAPTYYPITWSASEGLITPPSGLSYVYVTNDGTVTNDATTPTNALRRTRIYLARISVTGGVITGISQTGMPTQQLAQQLRDVMNAIGTMKTSGLVLSAASTDLTLALSSGTLLSAGAGFPASPLDPHTVSITGASPYTFRHTTIGGNINADVTVLDVGNYNPSGSTVSAMTGGVGASQIFTCWMFPSTAGNLRIQYGQAVYSSLDAAQAAITTRSVTYPPGFEGAAIILGWICVTRTATNLSDTSQARFIRANRFGGFGP